MIDTNEPNSNEKSDDNQISEIIDTVQDIQDNDITSIGALIKRLGYASFTPVLLFISLVIITPLSGVPGLSSLCGLMIMLISAQLLLGREELWLPKFLTSHKFDSDRLSNALCQIETPLDWVQSITTRRLAFLTKPPISHGLYLVCMICGAAMPFLELLPMTSTLLASVVAMLALALISKDGVFALLGLTVLTAAIALIITLGRTLLFSIT